MFQIVVSLNEACAIFELKIIITIIQDFMNYEELDFCNENSFLSFLSIDPMNLTCKGRGKGKGYDSSGTPQNCLFPFIHGGKIFKGCATNGRSGSWCATKVDSKGKIKNWARCNQYCQKDNGMFF